MTTEPRPVVPGMEELRIEMTEKVWRSGCAIGPRSAERLVDLVFAEIAAAGLSIVASDTIGRVRRELQEVNQSCDGLLYLTPEDCAAIGWAVDWQSGDPLAGGDR